MNVKKVIVDALPKNCLECEFCGYDDCILSGRALSWDKSYKRPQHCLLCEEGGNGLDLSK